MDGLLLAGFDGEDEAAAGEEVEAGFESPDDEPPDPAPSLFDPLPSLLDPDEPEPESAPEAGFARESVR
ncbi:hypothetical protein GCM10025867_17080 [Frondihabitans sucicola]|uniref:Uncharacterized protein n=1 Tax=Frondihabitans sucicola TaxID=1268041 RepID=A0ABN6XWR1_9MICO|nr:hypothetical protein GCM10025867_17080 [Frondihabitans sucicola]